MPRAGAVQSCGWRAGAGGNGVRPQSESSSRGRVLWCVKARVSAEERSPGAWARGEAAGQFNFTLGNVLWPLNQPSWGYRGAGGCFWRLGGEGSCVRTGLRSGGLFPRVNVNTAVLLCPVITRLGITVSLELTDTASPCCTRKADAERTQRFPPVIAL